MRDIMDSNEDCELLFFDTFSHENNEELNLDLVQFPRPVYINEIRIIPLGARVQADFPGGHRLGATNPSSFQLEFFVNDLSKRGACTFERLGSLEYKQNVDIQLLVPSRIPTDGLVLRGWYSTITVAVYGMLTRLSKERASPPPPPPPQPASRPPQPIHENRAAAEPEAQLPLEAGMAPQEWTHAIAKSEAMIEPPPPPPPPPIHAAPPPHHPPPIREPAHPPPYPDPHAISHPIPTHHTAYAEHYQDSGTVSYSEHIPLTVAPPVPQSVSHPPPPAAPAIPQYDAATYATTKPWPDDQYAKEAEIYEGRSAAIYAWDDRHTKERSSRDLDERIATHEASSASETVGRDDKNSSYESRSRGRDRERRSRERDRSDYPDDDGYGHGSKRRDRDYRRSSRDKPFHEGFGREHSRERDQDYEHEEGKGVRDRSRPRDRSRDRGSRRRSRSRDSSRGSRERVKRPPTPTSPLKPRRSVSPPDAVPDVKPLPKEEPLPPPEDVEPGEVHEEGREGNLWGEDMFEPLTPDQSPEHLYSLSDGEIQENAEEDDGYEEIISDEEDMSDGDEGQMDMTDMDYELGDDTWNYMSSFNPFQCELTALQFFSDPSLSAFESMCLKVKVDPAGKALSEEGQKLVDLIQQVNEKEHNEKWVEAMESLVNTGLTPGLTACFGTKHYEDVVNTLIEWTREGLDFDIAMNQPVTVFKVRHMKAGIRLATALFQTDQNILNKLLDMGALETLLDLYERPAMTLPTKLLLLRALDAAISHQTAMDRFLNQKYQWKVYDDSISNTNQASLKIAKEGTGYQKLLELLMSKQSTRVMVALSSLLRKIHVFEVLGQLKNAVSQMTKKASDDDQCSAPNPSDVEMALICLSELTDVYCNAKKTIAQPLRYLPAQVQFDVPETPFDPYPGLYKMFRSKGLLESLSLLVSSPVALPNVKDLLSEMVQRQHGMLFLMASYEVTNAIHRALLHNVDDHRGDDSVEESPSHQLGMHLVYHLQALQWVDALLAYHKAKPRREVDDPEAVSTLHHLYTMVFNGVGRTAVTDVLSTDRNLDALLPFLELSGTDDAFDTRLVKSVCCGYATELVLLTVHSADNIMLLENFADTLLTLAQQELTPRLHELSSWLAPTKKLPSYSQEAVPHLMTFVKSWCETASTLPPELVTSLRILQHLSLPPQRRRSTSDDDECLKHKYAIIQIFSHDGLATLLTILQKVCELFLKPSHQSPALTGHQGAMVLSIVRPTVAILNFMLSYLIACRGSEFRDLTAIPVLLQTYALMTIFPLSSFSYPLSQQVQVTICETLLAYTQPCLGTSESEEALSKSLWTKMVQEILKYTLTTPLAFVPGLAILSELLPLPLPLQTPHPLSQEEATRAVNSRKLWSAHIHSLSAEIQEVIVSLAGTGCQPLQHLLRRVCQQLSDLAAPTALIVARAVLDAVLKHLPSNSTSEKDTSDVQQEDVDGGATCSPTAVRILGFLSYLVSHPPFKITLLHLFQASSVKRDEKYSEVLPRLLHLLSVPSDKPCHVHAQECIVSIVQSLCDPDIGLVTLDSGASVNEVLSSSLPVRDQLQQICSCLVRHVGSRSNGFTSVLPALRTLIMLTEHDLGFWHVKSVLERDPCPLRALLSRMSASFSKDSPDSLSLLSATFELLRSLIHGFDDLNLSQVVPVTTRVLRMSGQELAALLDWKPARGEPENVPSKQDQAAGDSLPMEGHPLTDLEHMLSAYASEEEVVEGLLENISGVIHVLNEGSNKQEKEREILEPLLPNAEPLSSQFASRPVFSVGDVDATDERLSPTFWLSLASGDDTSTGEQDGDNTTCDLAEIAEKCCPELDLKEYLEKMCLAADADADAKAKKKARSGNHVAKRKHPQVGGLQAAAEVTSKKPFISFAIPVAPMMRGRGFPRGLAHSSRANDPFRSRPPNTSRPPSMHVDDFVALETHHPIGGQLPLAAKRAIKDPMRGRGRGFDVTRVFAPGRGRYFPVPPAYGRREPVRGGSSRGGVIIGGSSAGSPLPPRSSAPNVWTARMAIVGKPPASSRGFGRGGSAQPPRKFASLLTSLSRPPPPAAPVDVVKPPQSAHPDTRSPLARPREPYVPPGVGTAAAVAAAAAAVNSRFSRAQGRLGGAPIPTTAAAPPAGGTPGAAGAGTAAGTSSTQWPDARTKSQESSRYRYYHR